MLVIVNTYKWKWMKPRMGSNHVINTFVVSSTWKHKMSLFSQTMKKWQKYTTIMISFWFIAIILHDPKYNTSSIATWRCGSGSDIDEVWFHKVYHCKSTWFWVVKILESFKELGYHYLCVTHKTTVTVQYHCGPDLNCHKIGKFYTV